MRCAVWSSRRIVWTDVHEESSSSSEAVVVSSKSASAAVSRLAAVCSSVRHVRLSEGLSLEQQQRALQQLPLCAVLWSLSLTVSDSRVAELLCAALRQLCLSVPDKTSCNSDSLSAVLGCLQTLPLTALSLSLCARLSAQTPLVQQCARTLTVLLDSLLWLQLQTDGACTEQLLRLLPNNYCRLRMWRLSCAMLAPDDTRLLCALLQKMPHLEDLSVGFREEDHRAAPSDKVQSIAIFTRHIKSRLCRLTNLELRCSDSLVEIGSTNFLHLFVALKNNARIGSITVPHPFFWALLESACLPETGWLTEVNVVPPTTRTCSDNLRSMLLRNQKRHHLCNGVCVTFIALRKFRGALSFLAVDVFLIIARELWESRNQMTWDMR